MHICLLIILMSFVISGCANTSDPLCESFPFYNDVDVYVICKGNFTEVERQKWMLGDISKAIKIFTLQDTLLDVLPSDLFHNVPKPRVEKVVFDNVSLELLQVPELGDPPLKSIKDTVTSLEIYDSPKVFAWDFPSLGFKRLRNFISEDSELISIPVPFFFWPELRFIQIHNCSVRWVHLKAFQGNKMLTILSLAHNKISQIYRSMFPKPADNLYSLDISFNRLESLPQDMFIEMDALQELKLDNNRLKFFYQNQVKPVWNILKMLWLDGNHVPCDSLCWMNDSSERPMFLESSKCNISDNFIFINEYLEDCAGQISSTSL